MLFNNTGADSAQQYQTRWVWGDVKCSRSTATVKISIRHVTTKAISPEESNMIEIITNPILGGMVATFAIGMAFTIWSVVSDWMWDRKNK